jgi:hypothetical protein
MLLRGAETFNDLADNKCIKRSIAKTTDSDSGVGQVSSTNTFDSFDGKCMSSGSDRTTFAPRAIEYFHEQDNASSRNFEWWCNDPAFSCRNSHNTHFPGRPVFFERPR